MAIVRIQQVDAIDTTAVTSHVITIASAVAGRLLIGVLATDKTSGGITIPAGWTRIGTDYDQTDVSFAMAYKVAAGGETTITWTSVTAQAATLWAAEYSGTASAPLDVNSRATSGVTAVLTLSTGTTGATAQNNELALSFMASDTSNNTDLTRAWTNSFVEIAYNTTSGSARPGLSVAEKFLVATGTVETTFTTTDVGDQMIAAVVTFKEAPPFDGSYLLEDGTGFYLLEDGNGVLVSEQYVLVLTPPVRALVLTTLVPVVGLGIIPPVTALILTTFVPVVTVGGGSVVVTPPTTALILATFAPVIGLGIIPPVTALVLASFAPVVGLGIVPPATALTLTTFAPVVAHGIIPPVRALVLATFAPVIGLGIVPPVTALTLTGLAPVVGLGIVPPVTALVLTAFAPVVAHGIIPPVRALVLTTFAPVVGLGIIPGATALTLTTFVPVVSVDSGSKVIVPGVLALILTAYAPTVTARNDRATIGLLNAEFFGSRLLFPKQSYRLGPGRRP